MIHIKKIGKVLKPISAILLICIIFSTFYIAKPANAVFSGQCCECGTTCAPKVINCSVSACECQSNADTPVTIDHITKEFIQHREWLIKGLWEAHVLPAMMLMTEQITATAMQQTLIIGSLFDAKHQLETQRLLQSMQAQAHKDYQPSAGMCQFGTTTRSLAASDRNATFAQIALSTRSLQRQLSQGDTVSSGGESADSKSRFHQFRETYCNPFDMGNGMVSVCKNSTPERYNKDINFTQTLDTAYTLNIDFKNSIVTPNEEDIMALSANLYGHKILPVVREDKMVDGSKNHIDKGSFAYMKVRALAAKRSVAQNTFAAQAAMKAQGEDSVAPYMEAILKEMGIQEKNITAMLGERPSYHAQMELLTKKLYQTPNFYTELYDKPANIDRKNVSMQAIGLMQRRDMYRSQLRSEAIMSIWLETSLNDLENFYVNEANLLKPDTKILKLPGLQ